MTNGTMARLRRYLAAIAPCSESFLDFAFRYCMTGEATPFPSTFRGSTRQADDTEAKNDFFASSALDDPAFCLRFGRIMYFTQHYSQQMGDPKYGEELVRRLPWFLAGHGDRIRDKSVQWLERLVHASVIQRPPPYLDAAILQQALVLSGARPGDMFAKFLFIQGSNKILNRDTCNWIIRAPEMSLRRLDEAVLGAWDSFEAWLAEGFLSRQRALLIIGRSGVGTGARKDVFLPYLISPHAHEREAARMTLPWCDQQVVAAFLKDSLASAIRTEREEAASLLWSLQGEAARPALRARLEVERNDTTRQCLIDLLNAADRAAAAEAAQAALEIPPYPAPDMGATVPEHLRDWLRAKVDDINEHISDWLEKYPDHRLAEADIDLLCDVMDGAVDCNLRSCNSPHVKRIETAMKGVGSPDHVQTFATHQDMPLACFLRAGYGYFRGDIYKLYEDVLGYGYLPLVVQGQKHQWYDFEDDGHLFAHHHRFDLRTLADACAALGGDPASVGGLVLASLAGARPLLPPELIWPYFAERPEQIDQALDKPPGPFHDRALMVLEMMPVLPARFVPRLAEIALHGHAVYRERAQALLAPLPGMRERAEASLRHEDAAVRAAAARWLERLARPESVPVLLAAHAKERGEAGRAALVAALEACGHDTSGFFDLATQEREAAKQLGKGVPRQLAWFPWHTLPPLRLARGGGDVPSQVVQAWAAGACKLKTAGGSATLRRQVALADAADRPALARAILSAWLDCDRGDDAAQEQFSLDHREWSHRLLTRKNVFSTPTDPLPVEPTRPVNVANPCRGVLGVAAVCGDETLVPLARPALKAFDGTKRLQIISLLEMLAAIDHSTAIQAVLAFASRHPVRTVRESAQSLVQSVAAAKGWSVDELADRTVPAAGLDDDGSLVLDFGPRAFTLTLGDDLALTLRNDDGKVLKDLPEPRSGDDAAKAAAAKAAYRQVKKELKVLAPQQMARLYDALCLQKSWPADDWQRYIAGHPILGRMAQRLVWNVFGGAAEILFRPLADGSLTDAEDNRVTLPAEARVRLAHQVTADPDAAAAWVRHLADYEVTPLFPQFGRLLPEQAEGQTVFDDCVGLVMTDFKFHGLMKKLGYERGATQDSGWYTNYVRSFPTLGIEASIFFTGSGHGIEDHPVALKEAGFLPPRVPYPRPGGCMPLASVPRVLAAELYADLHTVAAAGQVEADWERLTTW